MSLTFPEHYPDNCPPLPHNSMSGTYYRIVKNDKISDPIHYKSHYELNLRTDLEGCSACSRRALSILSKNEEAVSRLKNHPKLGKYIARLELTGKHGIVCKDGRVLNSHHNWWVPIGVKASRFCVKIEGPVS